MVTPQRLGELQRRVEGGQFVLGGALFAVGRVPLVRLGLVVPVNPLAEVDDVVRPERDPRLALELLPLLGLGLELLLVLVLFAVGHVVPRRAG